MEHFSKYIGEHGYLDLIKEVFAKGEDRLMERTGTGTRALFGTNLAFDLSNGIFPAFVYRRINWRAAIVELFWMLSGQASLDYLHKYGVKYWDAWVPESGDTGPIYGVQWRNFHGMDKSYEGVQVDQISELIRGLKKNPQGRRHIVSAWQPAELDQMCLPPCHILWQCYVRDGVKQRPSLDLHMYQRSADLLIGVPHDVVIYATLVHLLCLVLDMEPGHLYITFGDTHIYANHFDFVEKELDERKKYVPLIMEGQGVITIGSTTRTIGHPTLSYDAPKDVREARMIELYTPDHFNVNNYRPLPSPRLPVSV